MVYTFIYGLYSGQLTPDSEIRNKNKTDLPGKFRLKTYAQLRVKLRYLT